MLTVSVRETYLDGSLSLPAGVTSVVGLSGAGKTTLFRLMAGLQAAPSATMSLNGRPLSPFPPYQRPIAYVPQRPSLVPHRTIEEQIRWVQRVEDPVVDEWTDILQLGGMRTRRPKALSGGEQQRAALLRALASDPTVLLLDEALANIDRPHRQQIGESLAKKWQSPHRWLLFSTHDWGEAEDWSTRMIYLEQGHVFPTSDAREVRPLTPQMARLMGFIGAVPYQPDQWLWVHPALITLGPTPVGGVTLPGPVTWEPLTPYRARFQWTYCGRTLVWTSSMPDRPSYDRLSLRDPIITPFGEES